MVQAVLDATNGEGVDVMLEMSGNPRAIAQGFEMLRYGGEAALLGLTGKPVELDLNNAVIFKGATRPRHFGPPHLGYLVSHPAPDPVGRGRSHAGHHPPLPPGRVRHRL